MKLIDYFPTSRSLIDAPLADVAGVILEALKAGETSMLHPLNFSIAVARYQYGSHDNGAPPEVESVIAEAWQWLVSAGLICAKSGGNDWVFVTRKGQAINGVQGLAAWIAELELPAHMLHHRVVSLSLPLFMQGRFDTAVFEAFKELEVQIREAAGLAAGVIGTALASKAFNPESGPLTDPIAEAGERQALHSLMVGALGSYKNPHSHRRVPITAAEAREMLLLASHLLRIVEDRGEQLRARTGGSASAPD